MIITQAKQLFDQFLESYDAQRKDAVWANQSANFRRFWQVRVMKEGGGPISDGEADPIIAILDKNGRGNTRNSEAVAKAMVAQGAWQRMFNDLHDTKKIGKPLNSALITKNGQERANAIDELYNANVDRRNNLTGPSGNPVNAMLAAYDPIENLSIISMGHRLKLLSALGVELPAGFEELSQGQRMVTSHTLILDYFRKLGISESARTISVFLYAPVFQSLWRGETPVSVDDIEEPESELVDKVVIGGSAKFYMEKELENFLIKNWEHTSLGEDLNLIEEDDKFSQQYPTDIGKIDILATDRETGQYVVIELKKDKTSDVVVGQIARYMGWVQKHKAKGAPVRGIIIVSEPDTRLSYALTQLSNVELFLYKIDFTLSKGQ